MIQQTDFPTRSSGTALPVEVEKHYKAIEVAQMWAVSPDTIRRHFEAVPGVLRLGHGETRTKRRYFSLRIPARVLRAEHDRLMRRVA